MNIFDGYARYYDLLYQDKNYATEAKYISELLQNHASGTRTVLELGCGTGIHAEHLTSEGYDVHGVDLSSKMIEQAEARRLKIPKEKAAMLSFSQGDIRYLNLDKKFDAVVAFFHVISYQTSNEDLKATFATARRHVTHAGIFIFDCWYGPAVLTERPAVRVKRLENKVISVVRLAEPIMHLNENTVEVNYHVFIRDKTNGYVEEVKETHRMRYLFMPEIKDLFSENGMEMVLSYGWLTYNRPGLDTWGVCFGGKVQN